MLSSFVEFYKKDRIEFIQKSIAYFQSELWYARNVCHFFLTREKEVEYHNWCYYRSSLDFITVLGKVLTETKRHLPGLDDDFEIKSRKCQSILAHYPKALHNVLVSALQRKRSPIRYFAFSPFPTYTFSESHPAYSLDIESIEKVNIAVFEKINPIFGKFKLNVPFITLSTEMLYAFSFLPLIDYGQAITVAISEYVETIEEKDRNQKKYQEKKARYKDSLCDVFSLGRILMPRSAPVKIRATSFLSHEQFHLVIQFTDFFIQLLWEYCKRHEWELSNLSEEQEDYLKQLLSDEFGTGIYDMAKRRINLLKSYTGCFSDELFDDMTNKDVYIDYRDNRDSQLIELLCDLGGTLLMGPAYLFAFNSDLLYSEANQPYKSNPFSQSSTQGQTSLLEVFSVDHPPDAVRFYLIIELLKRMGFCNLVKQCLDDFEKEKIVEKKDHPEYIKWLEDNLHLFVEFAQTFCKYARLDLKFDDRPSDRLEADYQKRCEEIFTKVKEDNYFLNERDPLDIVNAIWYKMKNKLSDEKLTMRWRFGIKYSAIRKFGRIRIIQENGEIRYEWEERVQDPRSDTDQV
jgi:hypothetical protein